MGTPENHPAIERAVIDVQRGGIHARRARAWLLESDDLLLVAERAGSGDPKTLRKHIGTRLNHLSQIVERIKSAAHAVFRRTHE